MEETILRHVFHPNISFFVAQTGRSTFRVGCVTVGCVLQRSKHRSFSAAEKSLNKFVNEWNTLGG
jgi:hypothetical protein